MNDQPIPNTAEEPLDLAKVAAEKAPGPERLSLPEYVRRMGLSHCAVCFRGGHTRTPLITVYTKPAFREKGYACPDHVNQYVRPKDLKDKKR